MPSLWIAVHTHPQAETWASDNISRAGYRTFLPLYAVRIRDRVTRTLWRVVQRPLFPRYLFVHLGETDPWVPIRYARGVHSVLTANGRPQHASTMAVEALRATQDARNDITRILAAENALWAPGTPCRLATGILAGHPAAIISVTHTTARVSVMFLGEMRVFNVPIDCLVARDQS